MVAEMVAAAKCYLWLPGITVQATGASAVVMYAGSGQFVDYVREQLGESAPKRN